MGAPGDIVVRVGDKRDGAVNVAASMAGLDRTTTGWVPIQFSDRAGFWPAPTNWQCCRVRRWSGLSLSSTSGQARTSRH
jgi:hypothetical protein